MHSTFAMARLTPHESTSAASDIARTDADLRSLRREVQSLDANLAKALMINEALWELLRDKLDLTENDLNDKLYQIDMRDGQLDGRNQRGPARCPECNRTVSARHPACIYCGTIIDQSVFGMT